MSDELTGSVRSPDNRSHLTVRITLFIITNLFSEFLQKEVLINNYRLLNLTYHIINTGAAFLKTFYTAVKILRLNLKS